MSRSGLILISMLSYIVYWYFDIYQGLSVEKLSLISLIIISINLGLLSIRFKLMSIPLITGFVLYSVAMVPGLATLIAGYPLYSYQNPLHQLNTDITRYTLQLTTISPIIFTIINIALAPNRLPKLKELNIVTIRIPFLLTCLLFLMSCYLAESGPTLLTGTYDDVRFNRSAVATLAGVAFMVFWAMMYMQYRAFKYEKTQKLFRRLFFLVTLLGLTWLFLHSRRSELLGFFIVLALDDKLFKQKFDIKWLVIGVVAVVLLQFNGALRNSGKLLSGVNQTESIADQFAGASTYRDNTYYQAPSGIGNIMGTLQTSVYYIRRDNHEYLKGETIWSYPYKLIPSNLLSIIGLSPPKYFHNIVYEDTGYMYNGGTYILSPSYVNFGLFGFIIASIVMACISVFMQRAFYFGNYFSQIYAVIILLFYIKIVWYGPVPMLKAMYISALMYLVFSSIFQTKNPSLDLQLKST